MRVLLIATLIGPVLGTLTAPLASPATSFETSRTSDVPGAAGAAHAAGELNGPVVGPGMGARVGQRAGSGSDNVAPVAGPGPAPAPAGQRAEPARGMFGWPLAGFPEVVRPFEAPAHRYGPGHRGVDLSGAPGQQVLAAGDGVVAFAGMVAGRPVVSVDHPNGLRTTYEPVDPAVTTGQRVRRGQVLGILSTGHPGCPAAACLHWGVRRGVEYLDPLWLLGAGRVRLLPVDRS